MSNEGKQKEHRALVTGLRRIVRDPKSKVAQRLEACKLLACIAGFSTGGGIGKLDTKSTPNNRANANKLKSLADEIVTSTATPGITGAELLNGQTESESVVQ